MTLLIKRFCVTMIGLVVGGLLLYTYYPPLASLKYIKSLQAVHTPDDSNGFYIPLSINNVPIGQALIDTGAADVSISEEVATEIGLKWQQGDLQEYTLADNSINTCRILGAKIKVGNLTRLAPVSVCPRGDSLIGMSFVKQISLHIENDTMTLQ